MPSKTPAGRLAWFPFFAGDWLLSRHVAGMTFAERGLYIQMLAHSWLSGPLPADDKELAKVLGCNPLTLRALLPKVLVCWEERVSSDRGPTEDRPRTGRAPTEERPRSLVSPRLEEERKKATGEREKAVSSGLKGSKVRWGGYSSHNHIHSHNHKTLFEGPAAPLRVEQRPHKRGAARARKPRTDDQGLVIQHWEASYQAAYGKRYAFRAGKDGAAVKACLGYASGDVGEVRDRIDRLFREPFWGQKGGLSLTILVSQWNELATEVRPKKSNTEEFIESLVTPTQDPQAELIRAWLQEPK